MSATHTSAPPAAPSTKIRSGPRSAPKRPGLPPFQRLIDAHGQDVWRMLVASVGRDDAEDCYQETFVSALRAYPKLRTGRDRHNLRAWILTIAHNKALDCHRARARQAIPVADIPEPLEPLQPPRPPASAEQSSHVRHHDGELWQAVRMLPERQRSAVVLRFVGDLAHRDIAVAMSCSEQAARRSLHEGLTRLRKEMAR